jgi:hypothetical protein
VKPHRILASSLIAGLACLAALAPAAQAAPAPAWALQLNRLPANFTPGVEAQFFAVAANVGAAPTTGTSSLEVTLPAGVTPVSLMAKNGTPGTASPSCSFLAPTVTCETTEPFASGRLFEVIVTLELPLGFSGPLSAEATVGGGGAAQAISAGASAPVQTAPVPFSFLPPGLTASFNQEDGAASVIAGSHPYQQTVAFNFPTQKLGNDLTNAGHPRDIDFALPAGIIGDPAASPILCTEAQLESGTCPSASQVGIFNVTTLIGQAGINGVSTDPLYNMVPPPGAPAELATNIAGAGIFAHLIAKVRSDGDYGISVTTSDVLALGTQPIFGIQAQVWGDPTSPVHAGNRECNPGVNCVVERRETPFWTLPSACSGQPLTSSVRADSWEAPGSFEEASYQSADLAGSPVSISGCGALEFEPTLSLQPTTNLVDSPSGLDVDLHQPQSFELGHTASAALKDAAVTLPEGMTVNPSQADGLGACTSSEIGLLTAIGAAPAHFSTAPAACPDASKLGTVEVTTPLLVQRDSEHKLVLNPETDEPLLEPLHGSVYLAKPFDNPFGSLLAIYIDVEDARNGIVAKLAGRIEPDPQTGQITTRFTENPQLPLEDIRLHLYRGARASLITPPTCATHATSSRLTPWSSPEGADATPSDSFQTTAAPGGGACPTSAAAAPNAPSFSAGTLGRQAGAFSPFVLKVSREDGSQRLTKIDATLPPGLAAKFAGVAECSDAQIAAAEARSHPDQGALEQASPSCPPGSQLGIVNVGAGAGPNPFYAQGRVYLAGPYKGAPLSLAIVTPAIAGPFDLGAVVVRTALYVDPVTAQGRAVSDPLPTILSGIPLDVRSVAIKMDRPDFTLNPTNCDPFSILGTATSAFGQDAGLNAPFQVGGCSGLAFKPKLAIKLKGGTKRSQNPALRAVLTMPAGGANIARASVALPHSEFLDQSHIRTICTRVQFAAAGGNGAGCPAGSVYGRARAITPLLDAPLEGPVFLRSSDHPLPDLVAALHGQIDVDLSGRIDSHKGGIRTTFEGVPDAPVTKFVLEMQGGKKGLLENSTNLCRSTNRATAAFDGQNGKVHDFNPVVRNSCRGKKGGKGGKKKAPRRADRRH